MTSRPPSRIALIAQTLATGVATAAVAVVFLALASALVRLLARDGSLSVADALAGGLLLLGLAAFALRFLQGAWRELADDWTAFLLARAKADA